MERTNYVNKAKSLMLRAARTGALVIMPLAAAVSAHAASIALPSGNVTCSTNADAQCTGGDVQLLDLGSGIQGLSFFTSGGFTQTFFASSGSSTFLALGDSGTLGGTIAGGTSIPVAWNFTIGSISGSISSWQLDFMLGSTAGGSDFGSFSTNGSGGGTLIESDSIGIVVVSGGIASGTTLFETAQITVNMGNAGDLEVTVPEGTTLDFQSVASAAVPEPASVGMIGAGLAFLGTLLGRRRKQ